MMIFLMDYGVVSKSAWQRLSTIKVQNRKE